MNDMPWIARRSTLVAISMLAVIAGAVHYTMLERTRRAVTEGTEVNEIMRERAVQRLQQDHKEIKEALSGISLLGWVRSWGEDWEANTNRRRDEPLSEFRKCHLENVGIAREGAER